MPCLDMAAKPNTRARMLSKTRCRMAAAAVTMALTYALWRQLWCGEMMEHYMDMNLSHCSQPSIPTSKQMRVGFGGISSSVAGADCFAGSWTANVNAWVDGPNMVWCDEIRHQVQVRGDGSRDGLAA